MAREFSSLNPDEEIVVYTEDLVRCSVDTPTAMKQPYIDFNVRKPPAQSVPLNFEPAQKD